MNLIQNPNFDFSARDEDHRSLWQDALIRFRRNRAASAGILVLALIAIYSIFGPTLSGWTAEEIDWSVIGSVETMGKPSGVHYFGTDELGRDLFYTHRYRNSNFAYRGLDRRSHCRLRRHPLRRDRRVFRRQIGQRHDAIVDVAMSIPYMFVLILMLVVFGRSIVLLFVGIGLVSWLDMARIVRGQTLGIKTREFVENAVVSGVLPFFIILRHIVPNLLGIVIVYATLLVPNIILYESFISFLGLGVQDQILHSAH